MARYSPAANLSPGDEGNSHPRVWKRGQQRSGATSGADLTRLPPLSTKAADRTRPGPHPETTLRRPGISGEHPCTPEPDGRVPQHVRAETHLSEVAADPAGVAVGGVAGGGGVVELGNGCA